MTPEACGHASTHQPFHLHKDLNPGAAGGQVSVLATSPAWLLDQRSSELELLTGEGKRGKEKRNIIGRL